MITVLNRCRVHRWQGGEPFVLASSRRPAAAYVVPRRRARCGVVGKRIRELGSRSRGAMRCWGVHHQQRRRRRRGLQMRVEPSRGSIREKIRVIICSIIVMMHLWHTVNRDTVIVILRIAFQAFPVIPPPRDVREPSRVGRTVRVEIFAKETRCVPCRLEISGVRLLLFRRNKLRRGAATRSAVLQRSMVVSMHTRQVRSARRAADRCRDVRAAHVERLRVAEQCARCGHRFHRVLHVILVVRQDENHIGSVTERRGERRLRENVGRCRCWRSGGCWFRNPRHNRPRRAVRHVWVRREPTRVRRRNVPRPGDALWCAHAPRAARAGGEEAVDRSNRSFSVRDTLVDDLETR